MRGWMLAVLTGAALTMAMPAQAAQASWKSYNIKELGFSFMAPGEVKAGLGASRGELAGPRQTMVFRSMDDNVEYKATVLTFMQARAEGASIIGEREYAFENKKTIVSDTFTRIGTGADTVYGRKVVADLADKKGRTTAAFYFTKGKLIVLEATAAPAKAASADPGRFIDSIAFTPRTGQGIVELKAPKLE